MGGIWNCFVFNKWHDRISLILDSWQFIDINFIVLTTYFVCWDTFKMKSFYSNWCNKLFAVQLFGCHWCNTEQQLHNAHLAVVFSISMNSFCFFFVGIWEGIQRDGLGISYTSGKLKSSNIWSATICCNPTIIEIWQR